MKILLTLVTNLSFASPNTDLGLRKKTSLPTETFMEGNELINNCELHYQPIGVFQNSCPHNSVIGEIKITDEQSLAVNCYQIQLHCVQ